jgi:autotransporter-associated beta strand protein
MIFDQAFRRIGAYRSNFAINESLHLVGVNVFAPRYLALCLILSAAAVVFTPQAGAQVVTINEGFTNTTAPGWTLGGSGYTPVLTANGPDSPGTGWLRLTNSGGNESTYAQYNTAFNAANATIAAQFTFATYSGSGADGITFFLADASKTFGVGAYGGSLGYAQKTAAGGGGADINGMNGGYLGLGIDEFGNYSNPTEGRVGGTGSVPNAIAVRGPGQGLTGYDYLGGTAGLSTPLAFPGSTSRPTGANARTIQVILTATNQLTVYLQVGTTGQFLPLYSIDLSGYARPDSLILGFTGSTGGSTDIHEIQNVSLTSVGANLWTHAGSDSNWATAADWRGSVVPVTGADILLDNTYVNTAQGINVGVGATRQVRSVQIDAPFSYTLNNGTLDFNNNGLLGPSGILVSQTHGSATQTINSALIAHNAIEIKNGSPSALNLTGTLATNGNTVTVDGSGSTSMSGVISGGGSLVKNDSGSVTMSGTNTYTGGTTLNTGNLTANNNSALGTGALTVNGGTLASTNNSTINNTIALQGNAGLSGINTSGPLTQTGGSYTLNMANATQSGTVNLSESNAGRTLTVDVDGGTSTISGVIQNRDTGSGAGTGAGSLSKTGAGTLVLSGANTYTGTTTINTGTMQLGASNVLSDNSSLNLAGGTLNLNGFSDKVGALSFSNGSTLDFGIGTNSFVFGAIASYSGILTVNNYTDGSDYFGSTSAGLAAAALNSMYFSGYGSGSVEAGGTTDAGNGLGLAFRITPNTTFLTWDGGAGNNNWNSGNNWVANVAPVTGASTQKLDFTGNVRLGPVMNNNYFVNALKFDAAASAFNIDESGHTLTLQGTLPSLIQQSANSQTITGGAVALAANSIVDVTGAGSLTISSTLTGTSSLTKLGGGTLALSGVNSGYSGAVSVNAGILSISTSNSVLGTGAITLQTGGTLQITDGRTLANAIVLNGSGAGGIGALDANPGAGNTATLSHSIGLGSDTTIAADSGTLAVTGGITGTNTNLTLNVAGNVNVSSAIATGTGGVTLGGTGTTTFSGAANPYTGLTTVNGGTLNLSKTAGTTAIAGNLTINGGTVNETASGQITSGSTVAINGGTFALTNGADNTLNNVNSAAGGAVSLSSGSILTINTAGSNSINGTVTGAGALNTQGTGNVILGGNNTYSGGSTIASVVTALNSGSLGTGTVAINSSGNLQVQGGISLGNNFTLNSPGTAANDGAIQNVSGNNTIGGTVALAGNSRFQSDSGTLTVANSVSLGTNTLNVGGTGNTTAAGIISGTGSLTKDGTGTLTLSGNNTYTGGTSINAGTLQLGSSERIANNTAVTIASGATLNLNTYTETIGALSGAGTVQLGTGTLVVGSGNASSTFSGAFASGDTGTFAKTGTGTLTLGTGMNLTGGNLVLSGGTLNLGGFNSTFGSLAVTANSIIDFGSGGGSILNILGSNSVAIAAGVTLTIANWTDTVDYFYSVYNPTLTSLGQIAFTGFSASGTKWQSFDHQITPVPEPSTYGVAFMLLGLSVGVWWRFRRRNEASTF